MISTEHLEKALGAYLPRQRWFSGRGDEPVHVTVVREHVLEPPWPGLVQVLVRTGDPASTYQVLVGLHRPDEPSTFLEHRAEAVIAEVQTDAGTAIAYDAAADPDLACVLLRHIAPGEEIERARPLSAEQSNSSVVYDERLILKLFRRLQEGPNPDAEVNRALAGVGFDHVPKPVSEWREGDTDYAVLSEFLVGGVDGFQMAMGSLRDLYDSRVDPAEAGGDFVFEARRLGQVTGRMHVAMAAAFGTADGDVGPWVADMQSQLERVGDGDVPVDRVAEVYRRLTELPAPGPAIRVHGDYHLGQVMRTDRGWYVLDFEGEPARPLEERRRPTSPLKDVAGMLRSFHYAAEVGLREWVAEPDDEARGLARAWEDRNGLAFLEGYFSAPDVGSVLPIGEEARDAVLDAFLLDKAVYEVGYERAHRPDWVEIPLSAVRRLLETTP